MISKKMGVYESSIHKSRYARYLRDEGRRETWEETVLRLQDATNETDKDTNRSNSKLAVELKPQNKCETTGRFI